MGAEKSLLPNIPTPLLAGRQRELAVLHNQFRATAAGRANVVFVVGEPGIGKTRLLEEAAASIAASDAIVLKGGASESSGMPPYLLFLEALGAHIRTAPIQELRTQTGGAAAMLTHIFPELGGRLKKLPRVYPLPPEQARLRFYEAVGTFVAGIAHRQPLVLIFDDVQWADASSLDLLCHVASRHRGIRLLILGAYRAEEALANSSLAEAVDRLNRSRLLTTVTLPPLSHEEITAFAASYLGAAVDSQVGQLLYLHSEGNPFFAEELARGWLETGGLAWQGERWTLAPSFDPGRIPPGIVGAIHQRVGRLPPDVTGPLETAAIIGRTFNLPLLGAVEGQSADSVEGRLLAACRAGLLRANRDAAFTFSHDKIRECLYAQVAPGRRQRLHEAIGLALEAQGGRESARDLPALAFHFSRSADRARGIAYSARAAEAALGTYAAADAIAHYRIALDLMASDDTRRSEFLLGLGKAALLANASAEAASAYETAHAWGLQIGDRLTAGRAAMGLGEAHSRVGVWQAELAARETAVTLLEDDPGPDAVRALAALASAEAFVGRFAAGIRHAERALELAQRLGDSLLEAQALRSLGKLLVRVNNVPAGVQVLERALALAIAVDDPAEVGQCSYRIAYTVRRIGELRRCREMSLARIECARRVHDAYELLDAQAWLALVAVDVGNWSEAEELIAQVEPVVAHMANAQPHEAILRARGHLAYRRGDYAGAERHYRALQESFDKSPEVLGRYQAPLGLVLLRVGKREEAQAHVAHLEALLASTAPGSMPTAPILVFLADMALQMGDHQRILRFYPPLLVFEGQHHNLFLIDRILAAIETLKGDWTAAETHLASAEALARREGVRPELPLVLAGRAELEVARGGRGSAARARALIAEALSLFQELGMAADVARIRRRLRALPHQPGGPATASCPAGLSRREIEVLRLVAAGQSNRQIAQELALSEKTVARHLTHIYTKTDTHNRAGAATFAVHHGLA